MRKLRDYQKAMLAYTLNVKHPALFVQMRLGKTIVTIRSIKLRGCSKILVVAPYSALDGWYNELHLENQGSRGIVQLFGTSQERHDILRSSFENSRWFLLNKEGYRSLTNVKDFPFDCVVIDESFIRRPQSAVTKYFTKYFRDAKHRYLLTGTPAPESELDYFTQLQFLNHLHWKEKTYWDFRFKNFAIVNYTAFIKPTSSQYLQNVLAKNCFFLSRSDVKLGGIKIHEMRFVEMSKSVRKMYEQVEREFAIDTAEGRNETMYATTKYIWLRRLCGGFAETTFVSYAKLFDLWSLLSTELLDEQVVILAKHVNEVKMIAKFLTKHKKRCGIVWGGIDKRKRPEIISAFQSGKLDYFVAQPETIKHGTNLSASDTIVFYTTPDGGETRMQVEDRIVNTATNDASLIIDLVCRDSVEEDVVKNLAQKASRQSLMKDTVQRLQRKYGLI